MIKSKLSIALAILLLSGCSDTAQENSAAEIIEELEPPRDSYGDGSAPENKFGFSEAMHQGPTLDLFGENGPSAKDAARIAEASVEANQTPSSVNENSQPQPSAEQIAYSYAYGFSISQEDIPELQKRHVAQCESMGPKCRVLRLSQAGTDGFDGYGELRLQVDATQTKTFGRTLQEPAEELGGHQVSFIVDGEDLSERIIDTEAKLQSRIVLKEKLTAILRNNRGSVDELVKAERAVAEVNEEIDSNRNRLKEMRNRIRFSAVSINYDPYMGETSMGFGRPVWVALTSIGSTLGMTISALIYIATALVPITIFLLGLRWLWRKSGLRVRRPKISKEESSD